MSIKLRMRSAVLIGSVALLLSLLTVFTFYLLSSSSLRDLREEREKVLSELEKLKAKLAATQRTLTPSKEIGLKFVSTLSNLDGFEITQVSETREAVVVTLRLRADRFSTLLKALQDNFPVIQLNNLSVEPGNGGKLFTMLSMRSYKGELKGVRVEVERVSWLTPDTFKNYLIAKGIITEEKEEPREEKPERQPEKVEERVELPAHTLAELTTALQESYKLRGVLQIGSNGVAILERISDGKYLRLSKGDELSLYLGSERFTLRLESLGDEEVRFSSKLGYITLRVK